jgi:hypothetical protein
MAASVAFGAAPRTDRSAPAATVDDVARELVARSLAPRAVHHLYGSRPMRWDSAFAALRQCGYHLEELPLDDWLRALSRRRDLKPARALLAMKGAFTALIDDRHDAMLEGLYTTDLGIDRPVDAEILARSVRYLAEAGHLPPTPEAATGTRTPDTCSLRSGTPR